MAGETVQVNCDAKVHTSSLGRDRKWYVFFWRNTRRFLPVSGRGVIQVAGFHRRNDRRNLVVDAELFDCTLNMEMNGARAQVKNSATLLGCFTRCSQVENVDPALRQAGRSGFFAECPGNDCTTRECR